MASKIKDDLFLQVLKPSRYIGGEINSVRKKWGQKTLKFALAFPEPYEIGMSHLGFHILYGILNRQEDIACERVFAPWHDMAQLLKEKGIRLFSIESRKPISDFDMLGFSLQYEMSYTNVLCMLRLAGIPLRSKDRKDHHPIVLGGGPCTFNPEPLADFFDLFIIGEAEDAVLELTGLYRKLRSSTGSRNEILQGLSTMNSVYVPALYDLGRDGSTGVLYPEKGPKVRRRVIERLKTEHLPQRPIVPYMKVVHDRVAVEIQRGCTKGCRFCQAGMIYRPTRQRSTDDICEYALGSQGLTGYEDVSFLSLNSPDHPGLEKIFKALSERYSGCGVSISLPSTRVDRFNQTVMKHMSSMRKTGFTFAPEAGSERLRKAVNKDISDEQILGNLEKIFKEGWNLVKLYFMIGLPTESMQDIESLISLVNRVLSKARSISKRNRINVNISPFVPKPHTPYQWVKQEELSSLKEKLQVIMQGLRRRGVSLKWHDPEMSAIEALLARGDRRLGSVIEKVSQEGGFDGWSDNFKFSGWVSALEENGLVLKDLINRDIPTAGRLAWDFIDTGIDKDFLIKELKRTEKNELMTDCAFAPCNKCGLCDARIKPGIDRSNSGSFEKIQLPSACADHRPLLLTFSKTGNSRFLSHLETIKVFERAFRRTGISLKLSQGFHPIPLLRFSSALAIGLESEDEKLLVYADNSIDPNRVLQDINSQLPGGFEVLSAETLKDNAIRSKLKSESTSYSCRIGTALSNEQIESDIDRFRQNQSFLVSKKTKRGTREIDLKKSVLSIESQGRTVLITFDEGSGQINPLFALSRIFNRELKIGEDVKITKKR